MSAEILRRAAALMRERATDVTEAWSSEVWRHENLGYNDVHGMTYDVEDAKRTHIASTGCEELSAHIASWHPSVALAMADWLDSTANDVEHVHSPVYNLTSTTVARAITAARAYLGGEDA